MSDKDAVKLWQLQAAELMVNVGQLLVQLLSHF